MNLSNQKNLNLHPEVLKLKGKKPHNPTESPYYYSLNLRIHPDDFKSS